MRAALLLAALAGCESGIVIEVRAPEGTSEVALFLATDPCGDCSAIRPPFASYELDGAIYQQDGASETAQVDRTGSAWFRFQPSEVDSAFAVVLAVGLLARSPDAPYREVSGSMLLTDIDVTGPRQLVIELEEEPAVGPHAKVWESTATGATCAAYVREDPADSTVIVPRPNPDCDGAGADDCDEFSHETNVSTPQLEDATCLTVEPVPGLAGDNICMIGGADGCAGDPCQPTLFCAPQRTCLRCMSDSKFTCIADTRDGAQIVCDVPVIVDQAQSAIEICDNGAVDVPLLMRGCSGVDVALVPAGTPVQFLESVDGDGGGGRVVTVSTKVPDPAATTCLVEVKVKGSYEGLLSNEIPLPLVARIQIPNLPVEGAVLPVVLKPFPLNDGATCESLSAQLVCRLQPGLDVVMACLGVAAP